MEFPVNGKWVRQLGLSKKIPQDLVAKGGENRAREFPWRNRDVMRNWALLILCQAGGTPGLSIPTSLLLSCLAS